jgi:hypothetical protein
LDVLFEYLKMHGTTNPKFNIAVVYDNNLQLVLV